MHPVWSSHGHTRSRRRRGRAWVGVRAGRRDPRTRGRRACRLCARPDALRQDAKGSKGRAWPNSTCRARPKARRSRASMGARGFRARSSGRRVRGGGGDGRAAARAGRSHRPPTFTYFANFAVGLCEGPIAASGASGRTERFSTRRRSPSALNSASEAQEADSLIVANEGGEAPAYRGTAYVVFERMPLADFGNRIPQLSFEVFRPVGGIEEHVRAVCVIPGSTEFGYDTRGGDAERRRGRDARGERARAARRLGLDGVDRRAAGDVPEPRMGDAGRRLVRRRSPRRVTAPFARRWTTRRR